MLILLPTVSESSPSWTFESLSTPPEAGQEAEPVDPLLIFAEADGASEPDPNVFISMLDIEHEKWSTRLEAIVRRLDAFFGDARAYEEVNETFAQLTGDIDFQEGNNARYDFRLRAKVDLPRTERRLRLLIETDAEEIGADTMTSASPIHAVEQTDFSLALESQLKETGEWRVYPAVGIKANWPPDLYARVRVLRYEYLDPWLVRLSTNFSWYAVDGPLARITLDFDHAFSGNVLFRASSNLKWEEDGHGELTSAAQYFILYHNLTNKRSLAYEAGVLGDNDPNWRVEDYVIGLRYRQAVYKYWVFASVIPRLSYPRTQDFKDTWSIIFRLEAMVGGAYH